MRIPRAVILLLFSGLSTLVQAGEGTHKLPPLECLGAKGKIVVPAAKIRQVGHGVSRPELIEPIRVVWPRGIQPLGTIVIEAVIDTAGRVCAVRVIKPSPEAMKEAAKAAVREARFKPATLKGQAVPVRYFLAISPGLQ